MITEEQRRDRRSSIGGSDAPAVVGLSPWKTALELYLEKTGEVEPPVLDSEYVYWGNIHEEGIARAYADRMDYKVQRVNDTLVHPTLPFITANLDRRVVAHEGGLRIGFEAKSVGEYSFRNQEWGEEGTDQVPGHVMIQCMHYLGVTDWDRWDVGALVGGNRLMVYHIHPDATVIETLTDLEKEFWGHVERADPPPADFKHPSTARLIERMYPGTSGEVVFLHEDMYQKAHEDLEEVKARLKKLEIEKKELTTMLRARIADAAAGIFPDGSGYVRREVAQKEIAYTRKAYMDFRFTKKVKLP